MNIFSAMFNLKITAWKSRLYSGATFTVWLVLSMALFPGFGNADVVFDLLGDSTIYNQLDGESSSSVIKGGYGATLMASEGTLNRTASGFGINGPGADDTDALILGQYIDITFDQPVYFKTLNVSSWNTSFDIGDVLLGSGAVYFSQGAISGRGDTGYNFAVNSGQSVRIKAIATENIGNGFSVDSFTIAGIPEPAVLSLVILFGIGSLVARRLFK